MHTHRLAYKRKKSYIEIHTHFVLMGASEYQLECTRYSAYVLMRLVCTYMCSNLAMWREFFMYLCLLAVNILCTRCGRMHTCICQYTHTHRAQTEKDGCVWIELCSRWRPSRRYVYVCVWICSFMCFTSTCMQLEFSSCDLLVAHIPIFHLVWSVSNSHTQMHIHTCMY